MHAVGLSDLRSRFGKYVRLVKTGEVVLVTERGKVVAELRPPKDWAAHQASHQGLHALARRGGVSFGAPNEPESYPRLEPVGTRGLVTRLLDEERGER